MDRKEFQNRTKGFALDVIKLIDKVPNTPEGRIICGQLVRAATSVGANYRSACRGRSRAEFAAKLGIVEEEADESAYWMELIIESGLLEEPLLGPLLNEANQIVAMIVASRKSLKNGTHNRKLQIENQISRIPRSGIDVGLDFKNRK